MSSQSGSRLHVLLYRSLFVILFLSVASFIVSFYTDSFWVWFRNVYFVIIMAYVWYIFILLMMHDMRKPKSYKYNNEKIAVLVPVFNEDPGLFAECISSVLKAQGNKEVFVLDDGSTKGVDKDKLANFCSQYGINLKLFDKNQGKRHVLGWAVNNLSSEFKYVVTIDSDTVLDPMCLIRLVEPMGDDRVGAVSGDVKLFNENKNLLTRMIGAYYWTALSICRKSQASLGMVACCSGCLSAYRLDNLRTIINEYVNQTFMGEACMHSEDRHLTNLVLRDGHKVVFTDKAISYTYTPDKLVPFLKQQMRWKRGFIREATFLMTFSWRTHPMLFIQTLIYELTMPFIIFGFALSMVFIMVTSPMTYLTVILPFHIVFAFVRNMPLLFQAPSKIPGMIVFTLASDLILYWQNIYALFTVRNSKWLTR